MSVNQNPESAAIVNAIVGLGESLNLPITAEGIEDKAIEERLRGLGCARGQGYVYGRPLTVGNARQLLAQRRLLIAPEAVEVVAESEAATSRRLAG